MTAKKSLLESAAEPFADLPWPAGVIAAALLAIVGFAAPLLAGTSAVATIWLQFGRWVAWLLAALVLGYTGLGVWRRLMDRRTFDGTDDPAALTWHDFERLIGEFYRRKGANVVSRGGPAPDGGVDLALTYPSGERQIVQCKQWKMRSVGVKPLRELWGVLNDEKADGAVVITSGRYTQDAIAFAAGKQLELIDGRRLRSMIAELKRTPDELKAGDAGPTCSRCGSPMVARIARRGPNTGQRFWGCSTYPKCTNTMPMEPAVR